MISKFCFVLAGAVNSLAPWSSECDSKNGIFNLVLLIDIFRCSHDNALWWIIQDLTDVNFGSGNGLVPSDVQFNPDQGDMGYWYQTNLDYGLLHVCYRIIGTKNADKSETKPQTLTLLLISTKNVCQTNWYFGYHSAVHSLPHCLLVTPMATNMFIGHEWVCNGLFPDSTKPLPEPTMARDYWHPSQKNFTETLQDVLVKIIIKMLFQRSFSISLGSTGWYLQNVFAANLWPFQLLTIYECGRLSLCCSVMCPLWTKPNITR